MDNETVSRDSLFDGELTCYQHKAGYRFSIDSVLIAHFVEVRKGDRILDLGTGSGIIMLILLYRWNVLQEIVGLEIQESLAVLAARNIAVNGLEGKGRVVNGDLKNIQCLIPPESFDSVVCNPPFYKCGSGRESDNMEERLARHQCLAGLDDFLWAAALSVRNKGSVYCVYPADQLAHFICIAANCRLAVKRLRLVYSYPDSGDATLALIHCRKNGGTGSRVLPPFYIYKEKNGAFSPEMLELYRRNNA
jgi:tRNA1Val (adenine37-N6)-methyltransferase